MKHRIRIGCAGWALRREHAAEFPPPGTHLQRYAQRFDAVEINSSFYRPHRRATYERWAASVPDSFRFAVKMPKTISHLARLGNCEMMLASFLDEVGGLGGKLGPLLLQLPPRLALDMVVARAFFARLRARYGGTVVCEPRNASWFTEEAADLLAEHRIATVAADPPPVAEARKSAAASGALYLRLHGSPRVYYSSYAAARLRRIAKELRAAQAADREAWCIFDNTAAGAALANALELTAMVAAPGPTPSLRGSASPECASAPAASRRRSPA